MKLRTRNTMTQLMLERSVLRQQSQIKNSIDPLHLTSTPHAVRCGNYFSIFFVFCVVKWAPSQLEFSYHSAHALKSLKS